MRLGAVYMIQLEFAGLQETEELMGMMQAFGATAIGAAFKGKRREENKSVNNAQILSWLAEAATPRNVLPTEDDAHAAAEVFRDRLGNRLRVIAKRNPAFNSLRSTTIFRSAKTKKNAEAALASALREACKKVAAILANRVSSQQGNDGSGLAHVTPEYAAARKRKYGVDEGSVLKASGQILENLEAGTIRIIKG